MSIVPGISFKEILLPFPLTFIISLFRLSRHVQLQEQPVTIQILKKYQNWAETM